MSNAKVTVPREVAEELSVIERNYISKDLILRLHTQKALVGKYAPLQTLTLCELARALYVGYEVERTPEEKVREYYDRYNPELATTLFTEELFTGRRQGVYNTLDLLGIRIEGINA